MINIAGDGDGACSHALTNKFRSKLLLLRYYFHSLGNDALSSQLHLCCHIICLLQSTLNLNASKKAAATPATASLFTTTLSYAGPNRLRFKGSEDSSQQPIAAPLAIIFYCFYFSTKRDFMQAKAKNTSNIAKIMLWV